MTATEAIHDAEATAARDAVRESTRIGIAAGVRRKERVLTALQIKQKAFMRSSRRLTLTMWVERYERGLLDLAISDAYRPNDHESLLQCPDDIDPRCLGVLFREFVLLGICKEIGYVRSSRPDAHARRIVLYRLIDIDAARRYLAVTAEPGATPRKDCPAKDPNAATPRSESPPAARPRKSCAAKEEAKRRPPPKPPPIKKVREQQLHLLFPDQV